MNPVLTFWPFTTTKTSGAGVFLEKDNGAVEESRAHKEQLRELGKTHCSLNYLEGRCSEGWVCLFYHVSSKSILGNGIKLHQGKFKLETKIHCRSD